MNQLKIYQKHTKASGDRFHNVLQFDSNGRSALTRLPLERSQIFFMLPAEIRVEEFGVFSTCGFGGTEYTERNVIMIKKQ